MNTVSRRRFTALIAGDTAVASVAPARLLAAQSASDRSYESELTGSVVDLVDEQFTFDTEFSGVTESTGYTHELVMLRGDSSSIEIVFVQTESTAEEHMQQIQENWKANYDSLEIVDSGTTEFGPWWAGSAYYADLDLTLSIYCELQEGAYENADLLISLNSNPETYVDNLEALQSGVLVGDAVPMVMMEETNASAIVFPSVGSSTTNGRTTRTTRQTGETEETPDTDTTTTSSGGGDFVDAISLHREKFMGEMELFVGGLAVIADETSTEADTDQAVLDMNDAAASWPDYSTEAATLAVPADMQSLGTTYLNWADEVSELGDIWFGILDGTRAVDELFPQIDVLDAADKTLVAELEAS